MEFKDLQFAIKEIDSSIRALKAIDTQECWFAGSNNKFGFTKDAGQTWQIDSIIHEDLKLEFRAIEKTDEAIYLLSVASPALLFKSVDEGNNWKLVYQNKHPKVFFNALQFANNDFGIAVGDPIDGCMNIICTNDAGENWKKIDCSILPKTLKEEFNFAASNTNISIQDQMVYIVTGGVKSRLVRLQFDADFDKIIDSQIFQSPLIEGGKMTGIFTCDFYDKKTGIIAGGNWEDKSYKQKSIAITKDGGMNWQNISDQLPYTSCIQFAPHTNGKQVLSCSTEGIYLSQDRGLTFQKISDEEFYSFRYSEDGKKVYFSGKNKLSVFSF